MWVFARGGRDAFEGKLGTADSIDGTRRDQGRALTFDWLTDRTLRVCVRPYTVLVYDKVLLYLDITGT